jgi:hypothetical protein
MRTLLRLTVVIAALSVGAEALAQASTNRPQALGGGGRFVFGQINEFSADQYLLDTQTGRVWRLVDTADGTASVFEPIRFQLPDGSSQSMPPQPDSAPAPMALPPLQRPPLEEEQ